MTRAGLGALCASLTLAATGCGGSDNSAASGEEAVTNFYTAFAERDAKRACAQLLDASPKKQSDLVFRLANLKGGASWERPNCSAAVRNAPSSVRKVAEEVKVSPQGGQGPNANVPVELDGSVKLTAFAIGDGDNWKINDIQ